MAAQAYRLYVLALAGKGRPGAARVMAERINALPTPLAKAQLGAALALAHDQPRAEAAFAAALAAPARKWWAFDYGTALRDQAAIAVLLKESGLPGDRLARLIEAMPGADLSPDTLSTQEQAWAAAAAAVLSRNGAPGAHRGGWQGSAAGADAVGRADRADDGAQPGGAGGMADRLGDRRSGDAAAGSPVGDADHPASSRRWTASRWTWIT